MTVYSASRGLHLAQPCNSSCSASWASRRVVEHPRPLITLQCTSLTPARAHQRPVLTVSPHATQEEDVQLKKKQEWYNNMIRTGQMRLITSDAEEAELDEADDTWVPPS